MPVIHDKKRLERVFLVLLLCCSSVFFLKNLGNQYLWQDEAQTALVSKTIFTHGVPLGYDGKNFFSQELKAEYGENYIWKWHTWLPFYVLAGFFKVFGVNTFTARLPFALFGIGTVFLTYFFCKSMWQDRKIAALAAVLLFVSVPFLLLSRQCRYYSMAAFFSTLGLYTYVAVLNRKRYSHIIFVLALTFLFHTHYIYCATLLAAVILHAMLVRRDRLVIVLLLAGIVTLVNVPWIIWLSGMKYADRYGQHMFNIKKCFKFAIAYLSDISQHLFSPYLLFVIPAAILGARLRKQSLSFRNSSFWQMFLLLVLFLILNIVALVAVSPAPFFRYLAPLIPIFVIMTALLVNLAARLHFVLSIIVVIFVVFAGPLKNFIYELTHDYDGPTEGIVKYLNENGAKNDVVAITYGDMPLKFYTQMRVIGGLTGEDLSPAKQAQWIIIRKHIVCSKDADVRDYILKNIDRSKYKAIKINYPDIRFENREEIGVHNFKTVVDEQRVHIFSRIKKRLPLESD